MPKPKKPAYTLHKPSGQARVRIDGKDYYLGPFASPEARERYEDLLAEWIAKQGDLRNYALTVNELALLYLDHAGSHYRKNGEPTSECNCIRQALRPLLRLYGQTRARVFGPKALKETRQAMISAGLVRTSINIHVGRIRRMFKWAVAEELIPATVLMALTAVSGVEAGRTAAKESEPVKPVPQEMIDAVQPFVSRQVWAMIQVQLATAMRPGEVVQMRGSDLNMTGHVWDYTPRSHKASHHGKERIIDIGPRAQEVIRAFLKTDLSAALFSPHEARLEFIAANYHSVKTVARGKRFLRDHYSVESYETAIRRACERAYSMPKELRKIDKKLAGDQRKKLKRKAAEWRRQFCWHPHQLRHNAATEIRRRFGIEAARTVLGHASAVTTEIYAEMDRCKSRDIIGQVG